MPVAKPMIRAAVDEFDNQGKLVVTYMSNEGAHVAKVDPPFSTGAIKIITKSAGERVFSGRW